MNIDNRNGLWRSIWIITLKPNRSEAEIFGKIKAQVHYYENGNVQLVSFKEIKELMNFTVNSHYTFIYIRINELIILQQKKG